MYIGPFHYASLFFSSSLGLFSLFILDIHLLITSVSIKCISPFILLFVYFWLIFIVKFVTIVLSASVFSFVKTFLYLSVYCDFLVCLFYCSHVFAKESVCFEK